MLGLEMEARNQWAEAEKLYRTSIKASKVKQDAYDRLAKLALREERWKDAIAQYRPVIHVPGATEGFDDIPSWTGRCFTTDACSILTSS